MAKRKLTTIFCADAVHYSAMMADNEDATLDRLQTYRDVMRDQFSRFNGQEINTWGDAIIAEFESVVEAVRCAVEIQTALKSSNDMLPQKEKLQFRIGINLGDVIHQGDNIYGTGVNVASRLEAFAEPGGIMVSKAVHEFAAKQLAVGFDYAGEQPVKTGEDPIIGYSVRLGGSNSAPSGEKSPSNDDGVVENSLPRIRDDVKSLAGNFSALPSVSRFVGWFQSQSKKVQVSAAMIGFFFAINLLFSGITSPWFIFPSLPFLLVILIGKNKNT